MTGGAAPPPAHPVGPAALAHTHPGTGHGHGGGGGAGGGDLFGVLLPALAALVPALGYLLLVRRAHHRGPRHEWSAWRSASFLAGCGLAAAAVLPPLAPWAHGDFRGHMAQHLLIGMYAPVALVLGAPVTLLLRTLPGARARTLTALLRSRPARLLTHPVTALLLNTGSLAVLYCTPLYGAATAQPWGHWLLHLHFLAAGCLFAWVVAGPDPAPARPGVPARLVLLGVAIAGHAVLSQLMYGGFLIDIPAPVGQVRGGAELMYYGGDIAELLLAGAVVATWRPRRAATARERARSRAVRGQSVRTPSVRGQSVRARSVRARSARVRSGAPDPPAGEPAGGSGGSRRSDAQAA
ncbi:cytochrome c oxidase assembly protein [Streptomyces diacarni]|uniref:Cytochrome c oxidase assembly protein n=1 Tax=Streptomyces diacarni TaxID=2800381 RepID=A0A367EZY1_9ACTN|nr:cytochrome c oxidase assembly protein [Streptomyces diacarni]RCG23115.1 cytochrome c oxidase assembly protein [Streptomyces diacarni]